MVVTITPNHNKLIQGNSYTFKVMRFVRAVDSFTPISKIPFSWSITLLKLKTKFCAFTVSTFEVRFKPSSKIPGSATYFKPSLETTFNCHLNSFTPAGLSPGGFTLTFSSLI